MNSAEIVAAPAARTPGVALRGARTVPTLPGEAAPAGAPARPRHFHLSPREVAAARTWLEEDRRAPCCPMRTAGSVVLVREGTHGLETFLTFRSAPDSPLGKLAFPGGVSEPEDEQPVGWFGPTPTQWAQKFGHEETLPARLAVVAAIRATFQEVGVLLAGVDDTATVENCDASETTDYRQKIAGHELDFVGYLKRSGLKLRTDLLKPIGRWQSPDFSHRRFDTHYFAAVVPVGQKPKLLTGRSAWGSWVNAGDLLADLDSTALGEEIGAEQSRGLTVQELITPGVLCILESLAACQTTIAFLTKKRSVQTQKPELEELGDHELSLRFTSPRTGCGARAKGV